MKSNQYKQEVQPGAFTLQGKQVLVVGIAKSGKATLEVLYALGAHITIQDMKAPEAMADTAQTIQGLYHTAYFGQEPENIGSFDLAVLSPGVPLDVPLVLKLKAAGVEIIGELELAYRLCPVAQYYAITGTNGKTTTTTWLGELFKADGRDTRVVGNIGLPVISQVRHADERTHMVTEVSSFQLETVSDFHPRCAAILNITPDHLNRHKTMENYIQAKGMVYQNMGDGDVLVLNRDNALTKALAVTTKARVFYFSHDPLPADETGIYVENGAIRVRLTADQPAETLMPAQDIFLPGAHNLENAMAAGLMALLGGVAPQVVSQVLRDFKGVAHRLEYVAQVRDVFYYNDSKGTNPDASIQAVRAMSRPTVLILGGMDKESTFDTLFEAFTPNIRHVILLGETQGILRKTAETHGFEAVTLVETVGEAVTAAAGIARPGWSVLLSPACASWDQYPNFEARGDDFKASVLALEARL